MAKEKNQRFVRILDESGFVTANELWVDRQTGVTYARLLFSDESPRQAAEIARRVIDGQTPDFGAPMTRGLYRRGVE